LLRWASPILSFKTRCTKGTYVRTLGHDLGKSLGPGGHLSALRRTASGTHQVEQAVTIDALNAMTMPERLARLIPITTAVPVQALG